MFYDNITCLFLESNPCKLDCKNGGQCVIQRRRYKCKCKNGFEGKICEIVKKH